MSLRDYFEKDVSDTRKYDNGEYISFTTERMWIAYQAATERALRILRCELPNGRVEDQDEIWNALAVAHERIKGES